MYGDSLGWGWGTLPKETKDLEGWGPGAQSPISKSWVSLGRGVCLEFRKLTINQRLRSYYNFHILYLMLSTPMKQGLLSVSLSLVGKVRLLIPEESGSE